MYRTLPLTLLITLPSLWLQSRAQPSAQPPLWKWTLSAESKKVTAWSDQYSDAFVGQCQPLSLEWPTDGSSTGPYTVFAFPISVPIVSLMRNNNIAHTVTFDAGSGNGTTLRLPWSTNTVREFVLTVRDGKGNYGGVSNNWFPSSYKPDLSCVSTTHPDGIVTTNSSFLVDVDLYSVKTCVPLDIAISGGKPPYQLTFVAPDSASPLTITLNGTDTYYQWIPSSFPALSSGKNSSLIIFASDSTGQYSLPTQSMDMYVDGGRVCTNEPQSLPKPPSNFRAIPGLLESYKPLAPSSPSAKSVKSAFGWKNLGITIGGVCFVALLAVIYGFWMKRRARNNNSSATELQPYSSLHSVDDVRVGLMGRGGAVNRASVEEDQAVKREIDGGKKVDEGYTDRLDGPHEMLLPSYTDATASPQRRT